ncbi:MAG: DEAD/DEAH box helicase family protein [Clostridia bacterium]|nr:DEAD/DEAH box helicase family protein [Clostridia bacterium]
MSHFSNLYNQLHYPIDSDDSIGLRNAQLGALHAIASHSTLEPLDTTVIVMPTGSGKTTVLMLAPYVLCKKKVLIVTPSAMVREQIAEEYKTLKTLKNIGVFDKDVKPPTVFEAEHILREDQVANIASADVIVASQKVAASISECEIKLLFDYVIIDEAHHVPAPTWQKIILNMNHAASLLVTATPFRLDKKEIQGTHIYNYPLSKAYRDGIFGTISFIPIDEAPDKDKLIALEAERVLLNDIAEGYDHFLMVRTDTKEKAKSLETLYKELTSLKLKRIDSSMSYRTIKHTLKLLKERQLHGIICVDMLGEGFDFPNLKIAAIHEPQKSLASTLQFVGRFARTNTDNIGTAKFIAMNNENLQIENHKLYTSDAVWQDMIIEMSEEKINGQLTNNEIIKNFSRPKNAQETISLHNIRPNCHAKVYKVTGFDLNATFPNDLSVGENIYRSSDTNTIVGIATQKATPLWLEGGQAVNTEVNLFIVHYQTETKLLFIYSQLKTEVVYDAIASSFCQSHSKIARDEMNRVLADFSSYEFFNTGMQNRYAETGESYRIYAGSNTAASIDENSGMMLSAGHAFCKVTRNGVDSTIGYSSGSKLWSSEYLAIPEYIAWCDLFGKKIANSSLTVKTNTNYDKLPIPSRINKYGTNILFGFFHEKTYISPPILRKNNSEDKICVLTDATIKIIETSTNGESILFEIIYEDIIQKMSCNIAGEYSSEADYFFCRNGTHSIKLSDYFNENPLIFKTDNDTIYSGNEVLCGNVQLEKYDINQIEVFDWIASNTDIKKEFNIKDNTKQTIQKTLKETLEKDDTYSLIIFDHGPGEVADYITLKADETHIKAEFYHCKAMKGQHYNTNVEDIYEVAQQAIKSTVWIKSKSSLLNKFLMRISGSKTNKFIRGDITTLKEILKSQKALDVTIYIVQPAISKSKDMKDSISTILSAASFYIKHTGRAKELKIIGSA